MEKNLEPSDGHVCNDPMTTNKEMRARRWMIPALALLGCHLATVAVLAQDTNQAGVVERAQTAVQETQVQVTEAVRSAADSVQDAGRSATDSLNSLWTRVEESRLKYRTWDEIFGWVIMGALAGSLAGFFSSGKFTGAGRLLLGLAGGMIGGIVVHVAQIDFGWGPVLIRYEELLFSFVGAILLVIVGRVIRGCATKLPGV